MSTLWSAVGRSAGAASDPFESGHAAPLQSLQIRPRLVGFPSPTVPAIPIPRYALTNALAVTECRLLFWPKS